MYNGYKVGFCIRHRIHYKHYDIYSDRLYNRVVQKTNLQLAAAYAITYGTILLLYSNSSH